MQTLDIKELPPAHLALLGKLVADAATARRDALEVGEHEIKEILTLQIDGTVKVSADSTRAPTCSIPLLATVALMLKRMGVQREAALDILRDVMSEAIKLGKDATEQLLTEYGVAETMETLQDEVIAKLPRVPARGQVRVKGSAMAVAVTLPSK